MKCVQFYKTYIIKMLKTSVIEYWFHILLTVIHYKLLLLLYIHKHHYKLSLKLEWKN